MQRTAAEARTEHIRVMGEELGTIYDALWQEVAWLHGKWADYVALFGTTESRVSLLNSTAPTFFNLVQDSIWENILLHIGRMTDPTATAKKQNLTIQRLPELIDRPETRRKVEEMISTALASSGFARDWRNRHIAHADLELRTTDNARPLELASRQLVNQALKALSDVMNAVAAEYLDSTSFFDTLDGDALSLLYVIQDGQRAEVQHRERLQSGILDQDDFTSQDI